MKVAIDDCQNVALKLADWSPVCRRAEITVFGDHLADPTAVVARLRPFNVVCIMRERTPLSMEILRQLPKLRPIASTGPRNASINGRTAADLGIAIAATGYDSAPTIEFTWSLIFASERGLDRETTWLRSGGWQTSLGANLRGRTFGVLGLGKVGSEVARIGRAFGIKAIVWSPSLTEEKASAASPTLVDKQTLFRDADIVTVHLILSHRTNGLIGAPEFALMKPTARLINTSRGPIVDEPALIEALRIRRIAGAAVDVFEIEPLPNDHPFRTLDNVIATPHIGYVTEDLYRVFYGDAAVNIANWIDNSTKRSQATTVGIFTNNSRCGNHDVKRVAEAGSEQSPDHWSQRPIGRCRHREIPFRRMGRDWRLSPQAGAPQRPQRRFPVGRSARREKCPCRVRAAH
nr:D-2-hydroxyacid dehydrogenase family protein [Bradyrhizobium rifense]